MNLNLNSNSSVGWFTWGILIFIFISAIITGLTIWLKGKKIALLEGFVLGIIGIIIFYVIGSSIKINDQQIKLSIKLLGIPGKIFINLIMAIVPLYIFSIIVILFIDEENKDINKKTYATSFATLFGMSLFGITIALFMIPLILLIPGHLTNFNIGESDPINIVSILQRYLILIFVILGFVTGLILKIWGSKNKNIKENSWALFNNIRKYLYKLIYIIVCIIPFLIVLSLTKISLIGKGLAGNILGISLIYLGIYLLGSIIIFFILLFSNAKISSSDKSFKEKILLLIEHSLYIFSNQSISVSLPKTQDVLKELGVNTKISNLTPTKGVVMGMVMCNGFTPTLIILMSLNNYGSLTFLYVVLTIFLVFFLMTSSSGSGSADYTITVTSLGILNISNLFYLSTIMPIQEINEFFIAKINNVYGHILASQITNKLNR